MSFFVSNDLKSDSIAGYIMGGSPIRGNAHIIPIVQMFECGFSALAFSL